MSAITFADRYKSKKKLRNDAAAIASEVPVVLPVPDKLRVPGQNFWVLSYAAPEGAKAGCKTIAIKCSGCFENEQDANKHAEKIRNADNRFDVHVVNMYEFGSVPIPADVAVHIRKQYTDKYLTKIMEGQQKSWAQSKKEIDERVARERKAAEDAMRKKYGPDYKLPEKSEDVKEYEKKVAETSEYSYSQDDIVDSFAKFLTSNPNEINPDSAARFMQFLTAKKTCETSTEEAPASSSSS